MISGLTIVKGDKKVNINCLRTMRSGVKRLFAVLLVFFLVVLTGCSGTDGSEGTGEGQTESNGKIMILFTSDVHCGIDEGFGYAGLAQVRSNLESQGYTTILVDNGDSIQGNALGAVSKGETILQLMNDMGYDIAIPGNHEFDYGTEQFLKLAEKAEFPYISCNFNREGELVFDPYVIKEVCGVKIAFVGVTTPKTLTSSTPKYFQNENGEFIYGFLQQDKSGEAVYDAVQKAVDEARATGADHVYVMSHLGLVAKDEPWTYASLIEHTNGIDVVLDGHSHDTEQVEMKNKDGALVRRSAVGTKLSCIGYSEIDPKKGIVDNGIWSWPNKESAPGLFGFDNEMTEKIDAVMVDFNEQMNEIAFRSDVDLYINDPELVDNSGNPIRVIRSQETNLGDFCADAFRVQGEADIGIINGGGIRANIGKGEVTYGDVINLIPFNNYLCVIEVTGQQLLDALEWCSAWIPNEAGRFLHVSGLTCEIDASIPSHCVSDENDMFVGVDGERRVRNVKVSGEPLDLEKTYTVSSTDYILISGGGGMAMFEGAKIVRENVKQDINVLIDYVNEDLDGVVGGDYAEPYGDGRIQIIQ